MPEDFTPEGYETVDYQDIPQEALAAFSAEQKSYIDEFVFYRKEEDNRIVLCYYGGECVGKWNGKKWAIFG